MSERILSLASLTVLELSPPEEYHVPLVAGDGLRRQTLARLRDTGIGVLDVEILRLKPQTVVADFEPLLSVGAQFGASELLVAGNDPDEQRLTDNFAALCDLAGPSPTDMAEILRQARNERRFPGEGDCDLIGLLRSLAADLPLSLEIPTVKWLEQGVSGLQRTHMAIDRTRELLARL
ncbi:MULTISPECIES: hypothetical protein [Pseudomonas]|uniref:hypothetical protein n=1 Tax=Pseudomonas TaxID=286 RepID=UPI001F2492EF|nr:hypothetical protein [Pseudomonas sputi]